jgi:hypothetical protein
MVANGLVIFIGNLSINVDIDILPASVVAWNVVYENGATNTMTNKSHSMTHIIKLFLFFLTAMAISPITNKLDKNQKSGDATKVKVSGELEIVREDVPVIDSKSVYYEFNLEGKRKLSTGEVMMKTTGVTKERRKLQKAIFL